MFKLLISRQKLKTLFIFHQSRYFFTRKWHAYNEETGAPRWNLRYRTKSTVLQDILNVISISCLQSLQDILNMNVTANCLQYYRKFSIWMWLPMNCLQYCRTFSIWMWLPLPVFKTFNLMSQAKMLLKQHRKTWQHKREAICRFPFPFRTSQGCYQVNTQLKKVVKREEALLRETV